MNCMCSSKLRFCIRFKSFKRAEWGREGKLYCMLVQSMAILDTFYYGITLIVASELPSATTVLRRAVGAASSSSTVLYYIVQFVGRGAKGGGYGNIYHMSTFFLF